MELENEKIRKDQIRQIWVLVLFSFLIRLTFLYWNKGEYTDGILQITLFTSAFQNTFFMPFYTVLVTGLNSLIHNLETSGKLISMISGVLGILPVYFLARRLSDHKAGLYASILYVVSPEIWRWQIRVMTDSLFCSLFLWSIYHIYVLMEKRKPDNKTENIQSDNLTYHLSLAWLSAGLATMTRYQGLGLVPLLICVTVRLYTFHIPVLKNNKQIAYLSMIWVGIFLIWLGIPTWWFMRGMGHFGQYSERMAGGLIPTITAYLTMAENFILFSPYIISYPIFLFGVYGFFKSYNQGRRFIIFYWIFLYLLIVWIIAHSPFQSFQYRYFIPLIALFLIPAGWGMHYFESLRINGGFWIPVRRRWVCFISVSFCLIFSVFSLFYQRETFGDIKESAIYIKTHLQGERIFDNEKYRPGVDNIKMRYWSGMDIRYYEPNQLKPGDYISLHNIQIDLNRELNLLNTNFVLIPIFESRVRTIPVLPDIMVHPPVTSRPDALIYKYFPQEFVSIIIRLEGRNQISSLGP